MFVGNIRINCGRHAIRLTCHLLESVTVQGSPVPKLTIAVPARHLKAAILLYQHAVLIAR